MDVLQAVESAVERLAKNFRILSYFIIEKYCCHCHPFIHLMKIQVQLDHFSNKNKGKRFGMKQPNFPPFLYATEWNANKIQDFFSIAIENGGIAAIHQKFPRFWWKKVEPKGVAWPAVYQRISTLYATRLAKLYTHTLTIANHCWNWYQVYQVPHP